MKIHNVAQNSHEWDLLRAAGNPTASKMELLFTATNNLPTKVTKQMLDYASGLASDLSSELPLSHSEYFKGNAATRRGHELEPVAFNEYRFKHNPDIRKVGFVTNGGVGCSPDGLGLVEGGLEAKCFFSKKHTQCVKLCIDGICPPEEYVQVQACMWICEREWWDLYYYHPHLACMRFRVKADHDFWVKLDLQCAAVIYERNILIDALKSAENM